ncbi:MAG: carboxypeptidase regulatory-like domain-containing protein [Sporichthyaceae bacterium]|nr:carboxypeptidase regulatory-like domain-containing protein [Sporichthyaceae bacterium]
MPSSAAAVSGRALLSRLPVADESSITGFVATAFGPWRDGDTDGCSTRAEVLLRESREPAEVRNGCRVVSGRWLSSYDGRRWVTPGGLRIDVLVPLREAWQSGAGMWSAGTRNRFRNDLAYAWSLNAVTASVADSRGTRDPQGWLPALQKCGYALHWVSVKYRWGLAIDAREKTALRAVLSGRCGDRTVTVPRLGGVELLRKPAPKPTSTTSPTPTTTTTSPTPTTTTASPTPTTAAAVLSGSARTADGRALAAASVAVTDTSGALLAQTTTDAAGAYRLVTPQGALRLVIGSGSLNRQADALPGAFRWQVDVEITGDRALEIFLPRAHRLTVAATSAAGRPLSSAKVLADADRPTVVASLWSGGPAATGTQQVAPITATTGADGRATVWAFSSADVAPLYVEHTSPSGGVNRTTMPALAISADQMVVAIPERPGCTPRPATDLGTGPVRLVSDLATVAVRESASKATLLRTADDLVSGAIPTVAYNATLSGDPLRYLYDEGVALRRVTGILAYAYAATKKTVYLDTMARKVALNAARWPDWNPGHPLDTAQVATAVSLAYGWSGARLSADERAAVADSLVTRMVLPYSCDDGMLVAQRNASGNQNTVIATGAALAGLAVRNDATAWASVGVGDGTGALARFRIDDGMGRSVAGGPTVEGFMYSTYEAASLALLHATRWRNSGDPAVTAALTDTLADLDRLAAWNERCGTVADPDMEDAWDFYPWVDRPTALATMAAWPSAGGHVQDLLEALQARDTLTIPDRGSWTVPDGIAELVISAVSPRRTVPPIVDAYASGSGAAGSFWGCATNGSLQAVISGAPNNAPHAHRDIGNIVVRHGAQEVLADLGQRDYSYTGASQVWRVNAKAHNTVGVGQTDGRVTQTDRGSGAVSTVDGGLLMVSSNAMNDIDWRRSVAVTSSSASIRDQLGLRVAGVTKQMSLSFLVPTPPSRVVNPGDGRLRFDLADGSTWELTPPAGTTMTYRDANPASPYDDTADFKATIGPVHTLVTLTTILSTAVDLTTTIRRMDPVS